VSEPHTDAALAGVREERAEAWAELQRLRAQAAELAYCERLLADMRNSVSWRVAQRLDRLVARLRR
jgi:hypothetical protein